MENTEHVRVHELRNAEVFFAGDLHIHNPSQRPSLSAPPTTDELEEFKAQARTLFREKTTKILKADGTYRADRRLADVLVHTQLIAEPRFFSSSRDTWIQRIRSWWGRRRDLTRSTDHSVIASSNIEPPNQRRVSLEDVVNSQNSLVLIVGPPGSGKTCLSHRLVQLASVAGSLFDFVFRFEFRGCSNEEITLRELLFTQTGFTLTDERQQELFQHMISQNSRTLVVMDGLDEYCSFKALNRLVMRMTPYQTRPLPVVVANLMLGHLIKNCRVIVTSRPSRANQLTRTFCEVAEVFMVQPLCDDQKSNYCQRLLVEDGQDAMQTMEQVSAVWNVMSTPIVCQIVCAVVSAQRDDLSLEDGGVALVYAKFLLLYIQSEHVNLEHDPSMQERAALTRDLAKVAWKCAVSGKWTFSERALAVTGLSTTRAGRTSAEAFISTFWATILHRGCSARGEREYYFEHRSLQEFFAALWMWLENIPITQQVKEILNDRDSLTLTFFCGLRKNNVRLFWKDFFGHLIEPRDSTVYCYVRTILKQRWRQRRPGFSDCCQLLQAVCESGDQALIRHLANDLPLEIEVTSRHCGPQIFRALGVIIKNKTERVAIKVHMDKRHAKGFTDLLSPQVKKLKLGENNLDASSVNHVCSRIAERGLQLEVLSFQHNANIGDKAAAQLAAVCPTICCLDLWHCGLTSNGVLTFTTNLRPTPGMMLTELNLGMNPIGDEGVQHLCASEAIMRGVHILKLRDCELTDVGAEILTGAVRNPNSALEYLDVRRNHLLETGYKRLLVGVLESRRIERLLIGTQVSAARFAEINIGSGLTKQRGVWTGRGYIGHGNQTEFDLKKHESTKRVRSRMRTES